MSFLDRLKRHYWNCLRTLKDLPGAPARRVRALRMRRGGEVIEIAGVRFRVQPHFSLGLCENLVRGRYEVDELALIDRWLRPGDTVMELGTGLGFLASFCAKRIGSERVFTFEANPRLRSTIEETYSLNGVTPTTEFAMLGRTEGSASFYLGQEFNASSNQALDAATEVIEVPVKPFNERVSDIAPTFLLCDIEGGEYELFSYARIPSVRSIVIELHPEVLGADRVAETVAMIEAQGFRRADGTDTVAFFERIEERTDT